MSQALAVNQTCIQTRSSRQNETRDPFPSQWLGIRSTQPLICPASQKTLTPWVSHHPSRMPDIAIHHVSVPSISQRPSEKEKKRDQRKNLYKSQTVLLHSAPCRRIFRYDNSIRNSWPRSRGGKAGPCACTQLVSSQAALSPPLFGCAIRKAPFSGLGGTSVTTGSYHTPSRVLPSHGAFWAGSCMCGERTVVPSLGAMTCLGFVDRRRLGSSTRGISRGARACWKGMVPIR